MTTLLRREKLPMERFVLRGTIYGNPTSPVFMRREPNRNGRRLVKEKKMSTIYESKRAAVLAWTWTKRAHPKYEWVICPV